MPATSRYKAFISYSHRDEKWAAWLQRALESYRLPNSLRQQRPELPERLYPIFRDKAELASAANLSDSIQTAMADSDALIVICSPNAASSHWVNEEIRYFQSLKKSPRIFCLLVDGVPNRDSALCAFPKALLHDASGNVQEPLAADATKNGDGKRNAVLKIAAGLLEVGVDDLKRRDAQRQARVWSFVAIGSLMIASLTIGLAVFAFKMQRESEVRRHQAENLISFMLGDLRKSLEPIGKLDLLDSVGNQAMIYFAAIGEQGTEKEMLERAKAIKQIGDVRFNQGKLDSALKAFEQALTQTKALHNARPQNNDYLFELGQAEFWVGYVAWERGDLDTAYQYMQGYMDYSKQLLARAPNNAEYQLELSYAYSNLGSVALANNKPEKALDAFNQSVDIGTTLALAAPSDASLAMNLADSISWQGTTLLELGKLQEAYMAFKKASELIRPFHEKNQDKRASAYYARLLNLKAEADIHLGNTGLADKHIIHATDIYNQLLSVDSNNNLLSGHFIKVKINRLSMLQRNSFSTRNRNELESTLNKITQLELSEKNNIDLKANRLQLQRILLLDLLANKPDENTAILADKYWSEWLKSTSNIKLTTEILIKEITFLETLGNIYMQAGETKRAQETWNLCSTKLLAMNTKNLSALAMKRLLELDFERKNNAQKIKQQLITAGFHDPRFEPEYTLSGTFQ